MLYGEDASLGVKAPKDTEGNEKTYSFKVTIDGQEHSVPVSNEYLAKLFVGWQLNVPDFQIDEPLGFIYADSEMSPREAAILRNALNAYVEAGRLDLRPQWERDEEVNDDDD